MSSFEVSGRKAIRPDQGRLIPETTKTNANGSVQEATIKQSKQECTENTGYLLNFVTLQGLTTTLLLLSCN